MNKHTDLLNARAAVIEQETVMLKLERRINTAIQEGSADKHPLLTQYGDAAYELYRRRDVVSMIEAEIEYDALPFWKKLFR